MIVYKHEYYERNKEAIKNKVKKYYMSHRKQRAKSDREYRLRNIDRIRERQRLYNIKNKERIKLRTHNYHVKHREQLLHDMKIRGKIWYDNLWSTVFSHYSKGVPHCVCCGEMDREFLQMDHIEGKKKWNHDLSYGGHKLYQWIVNNNFPSGFQVLCANCNFGKKMNNGTCPHKTIINAILFPDISK